MKTPISEKPILFEDLPAEVQEIKRLILTLISLSQSSDQQVQDCWFDLNELIEYLPQKPAKPTVYSWVATQSIPFHKSGIGGKKLYFLKSEIDEFLRNGGTKGFVTNKQANSSKRKPVKVHHNPGKHENS